MVAHVYNPELRSTSKVVILCKFGASLITWGYIERPCLKMSVTK